MGKIIRKNNEVFLILWSSLRRPYGRHSSQSFLSKMACSHPSVVNLGSGAPWVPKAVVSCNSNKTQAKLDNVCKRDHADWCQPLPSLKPFRVIKIIDIFKFFIEAQIWQTSKHAMIIPYLHIICWRHLQNVLFKISIKVSP